MATRKEFLKTAGLLGMGSMIGPAAFAAAPDRQSKPVSSWADGSRLVVSVSMQFEAGGQPINAESPFPQNMQKGYKDLPSETWYEYGYKEGIPRMLDNWDKLGIKVTSHMVGSAVLKNPGLAKEIVQRGHEAAAEAGHDDRRRRRGRVPVVRRRTPVSAWREQGRRVAVRAWDATRHHDRSQSSRASPGDDGTA